MWPARRVSSSGLEAPSFWLSITTCRGLLQLGCVWSQDVVSSSCGSVWQPSEAVVSPARLLCQGRSSPALPLRAAGVLPQLHSCGRLGPFCSALRGLQRGFRLPPFLARSGCLPLRPPLHSFPLPVIPRLFLLPPPFPVLLLLLLPFVLFLVLPALPLLLPLFAPLLLLPGFPLAVPLLPGPPLCPALLLERSLGLLLLPAASQQAPVSDPKLNKMHTDPPPPLLACSACRCREAERAGVDAEEDLTATAPGNSKQCYCTAMEATRA